MRVRFAPSPTGHLHVGGARTALMNWLFARHHGGAFILRIEDTDRERSTPEATASILRSMRWLGLDWDEGPEVGGPFGPYRQSERRPFYERAADRLLESGNAYRCYCTSAELEARREEQLRRGLDPRYDGRCRNLGPEDRTRMEGDGRPAAVRLRVPEGETSWNDVTRGPVVFANADLDDFVIVKSDGLPTYNFGAVVDDAAMAVSHVIRGDDHISNTPRQIILYRLLDSPLPSFAHVPMILGPDGTRLSKRHGATSVEMFHDEGFLPAAMVNFLALLGWSYDGKQEIFDRDDLVAKFDLDRVGKNAAIFNYEKLVWMNGIYMRGLPPAERVEAAVAEIRKAGLWDASRPARFYERLVEAVGERMRLPRDIIEHGRFALEEGLECEPEAWAFLEAQTGAAEKLRALAGRLAGAGGITAAEAEDIVRALAAEMGLKAGDLIHPARVALTGKRASLGIFDVIEMLGRERTLGRLRAAADRLESGSSAP